jgi:hypothetical protein
VSGCLPRSKFFLGKVPPISNVLCVILWSPFEHLPFRCRVAGFLWTTVRVSVGWPANPQSVLDLISLNKTSYVENFDFVWVGAAAAMWSL